MNYPYLNTQSKKGLINGVIIKQLTIHKDESGLLVETLRNDWQDIINQKAPFTMQYLSVTPSGQIRDEDKWHVHKNQKDRFVCVSGRIVTALYDPRKESPTNGTINLFLQGPEKVEEMYIVLIPENVYHGFMVISHQNGYLLNFPSNLYTGEDEGRVENKELDWKKVKDDFFPH